MHNTAVSMHGPMTHMRGAMFADIDEAMPRSRTGHRREGRRRLRNGLLLGRNWRRRFRTRLLLRRRLIGPRLLRGQR